MREIWSARGHDGVLALMTDCDASTVGHYAANCATEHGAAADVLRACLSTTTPTQEKQDDFMRGFLREVDENARSTFISTFAETAAVDEAVRLFTCAPFRDRTWRLLDRQDWRVRQQYWRTVFPAAAPFAQSETTELIDRFLEAKRPREASFAWPADSRGVGGRRRPHGMPTARPADQGSAPGHRADSMTATGGAGGAKLGGEHVLSSLPGRGSHAHDDRYR